MHTLDPVNLDIKPGDSALENWLTVRGAEPLYSDNLDVPHGAVATLAYDSKTLGMKRVRERLHAARLRDWRRTISGAVSPARRRQQLRDRGSAPTQGFIFDNLLAKKAIRPMIVVMPNGHVAPGAKEVPANTPAGQFGADFLNDVMPMVEARYRIQADRNNRAIVGLSMGAGHTAAIGFARLDLFSYIGLMSGVGLDRDGKVPPTFPTRRR